MTEEVFDYISYVMVLKFCLLLLTAWLTAVQHAFTVAS